MPDQPTEITAQWKGGLGFEAFNAQGVSVRMDSPSENPHLTPMELVLMALAGCTGMDTADILRKKRQTVASMEIRVRGTHAENHPRVYTGIELEFVVSGADLSEEAVARSIELSMTKYCSVGAMLTPSVPITTSFRIIPGGGKST
ncbi:MAG: OsmC family protein [Anaerolineales bacterium]|nr:OsmC family protein [Anaerolineales bacterium]